MKKLLEKIKLFFVMIFGGGKKLEEFLKLHVDDAISFIQQIKRWVDDPTLDFLIQLSPKKYRDKINEVLAKVEAVLDEVLKGLNIGKECLEKLTFKERLACAVDYIRNKTQEEREEIYRQIGVKYIQITSKDYNNGSPIPESTARALLEMQYSALKADQAEKAKTAA
jgi:hypothetical protein